uniref:Peptidase_M13_N domain-containing protein n=1 Tax=Angiostrongylus cantonensis TaxID=6313 RepID=A0A0K0DPW5_ANGCA
MTYPTDVYQEDAWPNGWGELTQVYFRSTDVNRTLISAYANIAGMFTSGEPGKDYPAQESWPTGWTPVPVHTIPLEEDYVGNVFAPCPRAEQLDNQLRNSDEFQAIKKSNEEFLQFLSEKTGMKVDLTNLYLINDVHYIETIYNMTQPDWLTPEVSERLRNLTLVANEYTYGIAKPYLPELIRLRGGILLIQSTVVSNF